MRISGHQHERSRDRSERDQAVMAKHDIYLRANWQARTIGTRRTTCKWCAGPYAVLFAAVLARWQTLKTETGPIAGPGQSHLLPTLLESPGRQCHLPLSALLSHSYQEAGCRDDGAGVARIAKILQWWRVAEMRQRSAKEAN